MNKEREVQTLEVVALIREFNELGLVAGQVGTVVEKLGNSVYEIEFCDENGFVYAQGAFSRDSFLVLRYSPIAA